MSKRAPSPELSRTFRDLDLHLDPVVSCLPAHEGGGEPANPWAPAARALLRRIADALRRLESMDLPTPGGADQVDVIEMRPLARALKIAAARYESFRESRRTRFDAGRRARSD